jgi:hypothetical protein
MIGRGDAAGLGTGGGDCAGGKDHGDCCGKEAA